ncbi:nucleotidyltransferase family protein [Halobacillus sp. SY10]|uniref:nucleotidyltransferase family protein n=1 Tax=Halobacillus sp. SY10 TaxID=3381356 RepID=UPI00387A5167
MIYTFINQIYSNSTFRMLDYHILIEEVEKDGVSPQIYAMLAQQGRLEETPLFFQKRLLEKVNNTRYSSVFIKCETNRILNHCEKLKYEVIPLKGVYFAEDYFGDFTHRTTSDIDILVRKERVADLIQLVKELGFVEEESYIAGHFHRSFSKPLPHSEIPLTVELHWGLMRPDTSSVDIEYLWSQAEPFKGYANVKKLSHTHTFYFMCLHAWRHNLDSIKHDLDVIQTMKHMPGSVEEVLYLAERHQTYKRISRTLSILYDRYPFLREKYPFPQIKVPWFKKIEKYNWSKPLIFFDYQVLSYDTFKHRMKETRRLFFSRDSDLYCWLKLRIIKRRLAILYGWHKQLVRNMIEIIKF